MEQDVIFKCDQSITCITTAKVSPKANTYYIVISDSSGYLYILKGFGSEAGSYKLFVKFCCGIEIYTLCTNPAPQNLEHVVMAQDGGNVAVYEFDYTKI